MRFTLDGEAFDLTPDLVRAHLMGHDPEPVRDYWVEIDGTRWPVKQVISLATGVTNRQRFQSQSSRRWLHNLGFTIGSGKSAVGVQMKCSPGRKPERTSSREPRSRADVVFVGCVKSKLDHGTVAKDLYTSDYFAKMRAYAESTGRPWFILSAEHGLVSPEAWLEPYDCYLPDTSREYRRAWGQKVAAQLEQAIGSLAGLVVDIHAGATYVEAAETALAPRGVTVIDQLNGLSFGRRLSWYLRHAAEPVAGTQDLIAHLRDGSRGATLDDLMASSGKGLHSPGMYSWWVDEAGAHDLSKGLDHEIAAGLIYAGLAGATRRGGATSSNTLWERIATMHLGKRHEFSTLRRSLGSILANAHGRPAIDEAELTRWMFAHLRVIAIPVADADTLDAVETEVLRELDPPLNLAKVRSTALREQLSTLRKRFNGAAAPTEGAS
jgi:hypothetical protein